MMALSKDDLIAALEEMASYMEIAGENDFKVRAYRKGADALQKEAHSLADLKAIAEGSVKVPGVGEGLRKSIDEFLKEKRLLAVDAYKAKIPAGVLELMSVPGLGAKKAQLIVKELGVSSVGELEYACRENRLTTLKGFGPATQTKIIESIENLKAGAGHYIIHDADAVAQDLIQRLRSKAATAGIKDFEIECAGALGRAAEIVNVFEFALSCGASHRDELLACLPFKKSSLTQTDESVCGVKLTRVDGTLKEGTVLRLWFMPVGEWAGSKALQQWLCADDELKPRLLKLPQNFKSWEPTWLESHWSDRKPATDAYRRRTHGSIRGVFHNHTHASDGSASLEEMVLAAEALGLEYIGISDHSQTAFYAHGLKTEELLAQHEAIQVLQKKVAIKIFHGVESDILQDGALDYPTEILEKLDFVVGSVHSRFQMDETTMTSRLVKALQHPATTFWGHPTGRLLLGRKPYALNWDSVFDAAQENGVVIELNSNPHRLDIDWRFGAMLEARGLPICINPDAHSTEGLNDTRWGELMAEKTMVPYTQILNLMPVNEMEQYLWQRKQRLRKSL